MSTRIQICLVSQQAAANLLPALDPALKPARIVLVVTEKMHRQAGHLATVLKENAITVEQFHLSNEQDFRQTENELTELAARLEGDDVTLNITGGTKLMSVAAQSVATLCNWHMFYVDVDTDQVLWLGKEPKPPHPLRQQLRLKHYLQSYGFRLASKPDRTQATAAQERLTQTLVQQVGSLASAIAQLNALAQEAENRQSLDVTLSDRHLSNPSLDTLLRHFQDAQALQLKNTSIRFPSQADRDFVKGGWLELHAIQAVHQVTGLLDIRDKAINLEVIDETNQTQNELDIAFMARNRLFVIECKTGRIDRPQQGNSKSSPPKANDNLFKLSDNCRRIGGIGTRGMLLSYRKLREAETRLARALNIEIVAGTELARLPEKLKDWAQRSR